MSFKKLSNCNLGEIMMKIFKRSLESGHSAGVHQTIRKFGYVYSLLTSFVAYHLYFILAHFAILFSSHFIVFFKTVYNCLILKNLIHPPSWIV